MILPQSGSDRYYSVYLALSQYPILSNRIRELMRQELYRQGVIQPNALYDEAEQAAVQSQEREGLHDPLIEEAAEIWEHRKALMLDYLTDTYFAKYFDFSQLTQIIQQALNERGVQVPVGIIEFNPETAPTELLFTQGMMIEKMLPEERAPYAARLQEIKVVLIRSMISDQLRYINIAKDWFTIADLAEIRQHKLGRGRIGGRQLVCSWLRASSRRNPAQSSKPACAHPHPFISARMCSMPSFLSTIYCIGMTKNTKMKSKCAQNIRSFWRISAAGSFRPAPFNTWRPSWAWRESGL